MSAFEAAQILVQSLGVIAIALTLWVYYRQMRAMDRQAMAVETEMAARLRPWVGLFGFRHSVAQSGTLQILLRNVGALPAQHAHLEITLSPTDGATDMIEWREQREKTLIPTEDGNYTIDLTAYPQFTTWREDRKEVLVKGAMSYSLGARTFRTQFEAFLRFDDAADEHGRTKTRWRNVATE